MGADSSGGSFRHAYGALLQSVPHGPKKDLHEFYYIVHNPVALMVQPPIAQLQLAIAMGAASKLKAATSAPATSQNPNEIPWPVHGFLQRPAGFHT